MNINLTSMIQRSLIIAPVLFLAACATTVQPSYVSPTQYQSLNCIQLISEFNRIQQYIDTGVQPPKRTGVGVGVGVGGGWGSRGWGIGPTVSVNMGQSSNTKNTELARLYGEQDAISQAAAFKNCPMVPKRQTENK